MQTRRLLAALVQILSLVLCAADSRAWDTNSALVELARRPFFYGREYFVLRSGRAQMIVQADRADLGPAFSYLLFDLENARQGVTKEGAFNFLTNQGFASSALEVVLGGFPFTALGHRTDTRWVTVDGVPAVEAAWWAGGVRMRERISALADVGVFRRTIRVEGAHLLGPETIKLRLSLPPGVAQREGGILFENVKGSRLALAALGNTPVQVLEEKSAIELGPITVTPNGSASIDTVLLTQIPTGDAADFLVRAKGLVAAAAETDIARTRTAWAAASSVTTADRTVQELFDKARFGLPGMIADDGTMDAGIFEYGAQWVRDTANTALGTIHAGHFESARHALERILTKMINPAGATMIAGSFDTPDREQFDQMGELLHVLKSYRDWTDDDSLVREHRALLLALIERPLSGQFRDETGMVHNRREFWERTFDDAYELAYQTCVVQGLRDAADLAPALGAEDRAGRWRAEADRILNAVLHHPTRALVQDGRLVKRRNVSGEVADQLKNFAGYQGDVPLNTEIHHRLLPDASQALPIALGLVDGRSPLARRTLDDLEGLWNTRWSDGGYDRYHTSSQPDQPGPWPFATCFILRAQHEARLFDRSRRSLEWLNTVQGGRAGTWFEEIPSVRSLNQSCGLVCWTSGEIALFVVRHWLGARFEGDTLVLRPALYPGSPPVSADLRFRRHRLRLEINGSGPIQSARVNGVKLKPRADGALCLPRDFAGGAAVIRTAGTEAK